MKLLKVFREYAELARLQKEMAAYFPTFSEQKAWLDKLHRIDKNVRSSHNASHILKFLLAILELPEEMPGCIVEAGTYKGASACKISHFARRRGRDFYIFDSFEGLPANNEQHDRSLEGHSIRDWFQEGKFCGTLGEVQENIRNYGIPESCRFVKGWFEETMPSFHEPVALAYLDVDLASSTRTCLKHLYPLLSPGGRIYSQDGDFPLVIDVFRDAHFWREEVGCTELPVIEGLGKKITVIRKP
ncbi:methyltransferase [Flaviaesturariibacter flavus]|uniref:Methyltransferase n=1 Tax=Flaviaesturariibacter flavus TaxID=2502780 RepID=A0A4R1BAN2_9BACT|nr:TylF/MycF/NovP-related O-methyltransferase [Flaviaesturariibacter flavus]TCJ13978.1 methyltransferase [Flaviaesturariibacter flavus]